MQQILSELPPDTLAKLMNLSAGRLADMDAGHVSLQVLSSVGSGDALPSNVRDANNQLGAAVEGHPDRFRAFAVLSMAYPQEAARELERAVIELGAVGALIDSTLANGYVRLDPMLRRTLTRP